MAKARIEDFRPLLKTTRPDKLGAILFALKLGLLSAIVYATNPGVLDRAQLLVQQGRFGTLGLFAAIWGIAILATLTVMIERGAVSRLFWATVIALSGAVAWGFHASSNSELTIFDVVSLWDARHEAGNAAADHGANIVYAVVLFLFTLVVLAAPVRGGERPSRLWKLTPIVPAIPILLISGIVYAKAGNGSQAMPKQYSQASLALLLAYKTFKQPVQSRQAVTWSPDHDTAMRKILVLVDESIRPDYLNPEVTPEFSRFAPKLVNFGPAASGAICSNYSNAILRFAAARADIGGAINTNPTLFSYAKKAGYRTVFIDAQAHTLSNTNQMQNFMTMAERADIDGFYPLTDVSPEKADEALLDIVTRELATHGKVFIYANKQGAHFPYDADYPRDAAVFHPTVNEQGAKTFASNIASYRNAIRWNVDRFFAAFQTRVDLSDTAMVYTSDHGQSLDPGSLTHCMSANANARMGLVPLYAYAADPAIMSALQEGAAASQGRASHFQIAPSLLSWMGYRGIDIESRYTETLTAGTREPPAFTMGDVFGLFSTQSNWMTVDLTHNYAETPEGPVVPDAPTQMAVAQ